MGHYSDSELILNPDGSLFHLHLHPEQLSDQVILFGDPARVAMAGRHLERVEPLASNREFVSMNGYFRNRRITLLSTGIGTDNVDIVMNELDALANINLHDRTDTPDHRTLRLIRLGTSGSLQPDLPAGSLVASSWSVGLDGVMHYYRRSANAIRDRFEENFIQTVGWPRELPLPYAEQASPVLLGKVSGYCISGITVSAHGFYGPQGRKLRADLAIPDLNQRMQQVRFDSLRTTNYEMESSALYGLSNLLGHEAITVCAIIANRMTGDFIGDYHKLIDELISRTLDSLITP